jgi:hypothetical protein
VSCVVMLLQNLQVVCVDACDVCVWWFKHHTTSPGTAAACKSKQCSSRHCGWVVSGQLPTESGNGCCCWLIAVCELPVSSFSAWLFLQCVL